MGKGQLLQATGSLEVALKPREYAEEVGIAVGSRVVISFYFSLRRGSSDAMHRASRKAISTFLSISAGGTG